MTKLESKSGKWTLYGDANAQTLVCGHSHVTSILKATMLPSKVAGSNSVISVCGATDWITGTERDEEYWDFVIELSGGKDVVIIWQGNQHYASFMFETEPKFTMLGVTENSDDQETVLIPRVMIKSFFQTYF